MIQTHRAPRTAIASVCSLAAQASAGWSTAFTGEVIGRDQLELWARGLRAVHGRPRPARPGAVLRRQLRRIRQAIRSGTVEAVYAHFGLTLSDRGPDSHAGAARAAVRRPAPGPAHRYALSDFGLTGDQVDQRFGFR